jgi:molecular chaperone DnaK (HSP70)
MLLGCIVGSLNSRARQVPPYYNQYERRAVLDAAALADLNVMSLINDETAGG